MAARETIKKIQIGSIIINLGLYFLRSVKATTSKSVVLNVMVDGSLTAAAEMFTFQTLWTKGNLFFKV